VSGGLAKIRTKKVNLKKISKNENYSSLSIPRTDGKVIIDWSK